MINEHRNSLEKVYDAKQQKGLYAPSIKTAIYFLRQTKGVA